MPDRPRIYPFSPTRLINSVNPLLYLRRHRRFSYRQRWEFIFNTGLPSLIQDE